MTKNRSRSMLKPPHMLKHPCLGIEDLREVWASDPEASLR